MLRRSSKIAECWSTRYCRPPCVLIALNCELSEISCNDETPPHSLLQSPHKFPDTPRRPYRKAESPQESPTTVFKTVPVKSFYEVVKTKTFKDFDEDLVLAEPFLVERDGKLLRTNHLKEVEEQQKAIETLKKKVDKKSKELASLEKKNKDGQYQSKVDKLTSQLEPLMDRVELLQKEIDDMNVEAYYFPGGKPIQIAPAKSVPGLGEIITSRPHCLVPRAFFKHSARDKTRMQASHAARVLAGAYSGESWLDPK